MCFKKIITLTIFPTLLIGVFCLLESPQLAQAKSKDTLSQWGFKPNNFRRMKCVANYLVDEKNFKDIFKVQHDKMPPNQKKELYEDAKVLSKIPLRYSLTAMPNDCTVRKRSFTKELTTAMKALPGGEKRKYFKNFLDNAKNILNSACKVLIFTHWYPLESIKGSASRGKDSTTISLSNGDSVKLSHDRKNIYIASEKRQLYGTADFKLESNKVLVEKFKFHKQGKKAHFFHTYGFKNKNNVQKLRSINFWLSHKPIHKFSIACKGI